MITAGIDLGVETIKAVILKDGQIAASKQASADGFNRATAAEQVWQEVLKQAKLTPADVGKVIATGQGKWDVRFANDFIVEPVADARAALWLFPQARLVIDVGADQARAVRFGADGKILEYVLNQKCAAGLGIFLESMARTLGMSLDEMSQTISRSRNKVAVNDQCAVLAELDVIALIHDNVPKASIVQAINEAVATKLSSMVHEMVGELEKEAVLIGGVAKNAGVVNAFKKRLGINFMIPDQPEIAGALGTALIAAS